MNSLFVKSEEFAKARNEAIKVVEQNHGPIVASMTSSILESLMSSVVIFELIESPFFRLVAVDLLSHLSANIVRLNVKAHGVSRETGTLALDIAKRLHSEVLRPLLSILAEEQMECDEKDGAPMGKALLDLTKIFSAVEAGAAAAEKPASVSFEELLNALKRGPQGAAS